LTPLPPTIALASKRIESERLKTSSFEENKIPLTAPISIFLDSVEAEKAMSHRYSDRNYVPGELPKQTSFATELLQ
jgi:hypothetical protein